MKNKKILLMTFLLSLQTVLNAATAEESLAIVVAKPAPVIKNSDKLARFLRRTQSGALHNESRFHLITKQLDKAQSSSPLALVAPLSNGNAFSTTTPLITEITTQDRATQTDQDMLAIQSTEAALEGLQGIHLIQLTEKQTELDSAQATFLKQIQERDQTLRAKEDALTAAQQRADQLTADLTVRDKDIRNMIDLHREERDATTDANNKTLRAKDRELVEAKTALSAQQKTLEETQAAAAAAQTKETEVRTLFDTSNKEHLAKLTDLARRDGKQQAAWAQERQTYQEQLEAKDATLEQMQTDHTATVKQLETTHRTQITQAQSAVRLNVTEELNRTHRSTVNRFLGLGAGLGIFTVGRSIFSTVMPSLADSTAAKIATGLAAATGAWYLGKSWPSVTMPSFKKVATCGAILGASLFSGLSGNFDGMGLRLLTGATLGAGAACFGRVWTARQEATATIGTTPAATDTTKSSRALTPEASHA